VTSEVSFTAALLLLAVTTIGAIMLAVRRLQTLRLTTGDRDPIGRSVAP